MMNSRTNQIVLRPSGNSIGPKPRTISREQLKSLIIIDCCTAVEVMKQQEYMYHVGM